MKKKLLIIIAVLFVLTVPFTVFAATSDSAAAKQIRGFFGFDYSKLNDAQKSVVSDYSKKMADLQKEFINKMVENGAMTKEQGDLEIARIDENLKNGGNAGLMPGFGMGNGQRGGRGGFGLFGVDTSKLTDAQKSELITIYKNINTAQKDFIGKLVIDELLTRAQGDEIIKKIDEAASALEKGSLEKGFSMDRFDCFGIAGLTGKNTTLTDKQKADLSEFSDKMKAFQKEIISKYVSFGLLTKEQGDAAIKRLDTMKNNSGEFMPGNGKGREFNFKGRMRGGKVPDAVSGATGSNSGTQDGNSQAAKGTEL